MNEKQRDDYEQSLKIFRDNINVVKTARIEGMEEGIKEGIRKVAINLLRAGVEIETISVTTGLSKEEINKL